MLTPRTYSPQDERFLAIADRSGDLDADLGLRVAEIVHAVRTGGGQSLFEYVCKFDAPLANVDAIRATSEELEEGERQVEPEFKAAIAEAAENIKRFHLHQVRKGYVHDDGEGVTLAKRVLPIRRVGVYCPAGTAPLFSSMLMNVVPARIAGVEEIAVAMPPRKNGKLCPYMATTVRHLGLTEVYKMGGAHAVAALAYGAGPVRKVDKIVGPGNAYVATAKRQVFGAVGIDSIAGPSEIVVIADKTADPEFIAADLLSQVEHGSGYESGVVLTDDADLARAVCEAVERMLTELGRAEAIQNALSRYGAVFVCRDLDEAVAASNAIAPVLLEIVTADPRSLLDKVTNAGAVFLGPWSTEPVGDYFAGTNHVLPTTGAARFSSSLGVADFLKDISVIEYSAERLRRTGDNIILMAEKEELTAHANAVRVRMAKLRRGRELKRLSQKTPVVSAPLVIPARETSTRAKNGRFGRNPVGRAVATSPTATSSPP